MRGPKRDRYTQRSATMIDNRECAGMTPGPPCNCSGNLCKCGGHVGFLECESAEEVVSV